MDRCEHHEAIDDKINTVDKKVDNVDKKVDKAFEKIDSLEKEHAKLDKNQGITETYTKEVYKKVDQMSSSVTTLTNTLNTFILNMTADKIQEAKEDTTVKLETKSNTEMRKYWIDTAKKIGWLIIVGLIGLLTGLNGGK